MGLEVGRGWGSGWDLELGSARVWGKAHLSLLPDDGEVVSHDGDGHGHEEQPGDNDGHRQELAEWRDGRDVTVAYRRHGHRSKVRGVDGRPIGLEGRVHEDGKYHVESKDRQCLQHFDELLARRCPNVQLLCRRLYTVREVAESARPLDGLWLGSIRRNRLGRLHLLEHDHKAERRDGDRMDGCGCGDEVGQNDAGVGFATSLP